MGTPRPVLPDVGTHAPIQECPYDLCVRPDAAELREDRRIHEIRMPRRPRTKVRVEPLKDRHELAQRRRVLIGDQSWLLRGRRGHPPRFSYFIGPLYDLFDGTIFLLRLAALEDRQPDLPSTPDRECSRAGAAEVR